MNGPFAGQALLLPSGKVFVSYSDSLVLGAFGAQLFDPATGSFQVVPGVAFQAPLYTTSIELLSDGRVLIGVAGSPSGVAGSPSRVYDPATGTLSAAPAMAASSLGESNRLLPDGRVLTHGETSIGRFPGTPDWLIYDPIANTTKPASLNVYGSDVLLSNGMVFTSAALVGLAGVFRGEAALYDPAADQLFLQPSAVHPVGTTILLDDGRAFGIERRDSSQDPFNTGIFAQIYTPPPYTNPVPRIGSVISNNAPASQALALDIRGESFLPNSSAWLGSNKLVTLYLGSQHLAAFVPPSLRSLLSSGIAVNNPGPGGGTTAALSVGATVPLPIPEIETGAIRRGYVVVTAALGSPLPVSTLTYGTVSNAIVQSQAAILPAPLTTDTSMVVDVVRSIGRDLGVAVANASGTAALITLTLRDLEGNPVSSPLTFSISARAQTAGFISEQFPPTAIGAVFRGSITIQSSIPVSIVGLRFSGAQFSTVPLPVSTGFPVPAIGAAGGPNAIMFPQFAVSGGWATTLGLLNNTTNPISGRIDVFDPSGNPMVIPWNGQHNSTFTYSIPARGTLTFAPRDSDGQSPF